MTELRMCRHIRHVPKVWGVTYSKLFLSLGGGLLFTAVSFSIGSGAGTAGKIGIICLGALITAALHGVCFWFDNQDSNDRDTPFIKSTASSQSAALQITKITFSGRA